jgi:hypothetical protein
VLIAIPIPILVPCIPHRILILAWSPILLRLLGAVDLLEVGQAAGQRGQRGRRRTRRSRASGAGAVKGSTINGPAA